LHIHYAAATAAHDDDDDNDNDNGPGYVRYSRNYAVKCRKLRQNRA